MENFKIKYNVLFFLDKEKIAENVYKPDANLRFRIRWSKNIVSFGVGYRVDLLKWDEKTQRCLTKGTHGKKKVPAKDINSEIQRLSNIIDNIFTSYELKKTVPTVEQVKEQFNFENKGIAKKTEKTLFNVFDEFVNTESQNNNWRYPTLQKFATVKNHLLDFDKKLSFDKLTKEGLNNYSNFLRDKKEMRNTTIKKQIAFVKWFLKWATDNKYNSNLDYMTFSQNFDYGNKPVIFLDWDELMKVYNFDFSTAKKKVKTDEGERLEDLTPENKIALEKVRDVFCFMCFTSLRFSDAYNLKRTNVFDTYLNVTTIKTADTLKIELNDYSKAILDKYKDYNFPENRALPVITMQKTNDHLKEIGELCGIDTPVTITYYKGAKRIDEVYPKHELLTTHCGRRSFICNALMLGIAPNTVMKWTGHSNYKSMQPYIDVADAEKEKAMSLFNR